MTKTTTNTITIEECRYCDGTAKHKPYGEDEGLHCMLCGAEWDGVPVQVEISFCHIHQEKLYDGEPCYTCEDIAETERMLMEDDAPAYVYTSVPSMGTRCRECNELIGTPGVYECAICADE